MITIYDATTRLHMYLDHLGIPVVGISQTGTTFIVTYDPSATAGQIAQGNQIASTWPTGDYQTRTLYAIRDSILALPTAKQDAIIADLWAKVGGVELVLTDQGPNHSAVWTHFFLGINNVLSNPNERMCKLYASCLYVQDMPMYLINPSFDTTISIPGWEPVGG